MIKLIIVFLFGLSIGAALGVAYCFKCFSRYHAPAWERNGFHAGAQEPDEKQLLQNL
jgi:hypothetical protein